MLQTSVLNDLFNQWSVAMAVSAISSDRRTDRALSAPPLPDRYPSDICNENPNRFRPRQENTHENNTFFQHDSLPVRMEGSLRPAVCGLGENLSFWTTARQLTCRCTVGTPTYEHPVTSRNKRSYLQIIVISYLLWVAYTGSVY